jgi:hypothetical protein
MRNARARPNTASMAQSPRSTALRLDLQPGTHPIRGCVEHADGRRQPFWGWLELIEALQGVAADENEREGPQGHITPKEHS